MNAQLDEMHDPSLTSWVESANVAECDFPIQNLPFSVFREKGTRAPWRSGVTIGNQVLDLSWVAHDRLVDAAADTALHAAQGPTVNRFVALGRPAWTAPSRPTSHSSAPVAPTTTATSSTR